MNAKITRSHRILKWSMMSAVLMVTAILAWTFGPRLVLAGRFYLAAGAGKAELGGITRNDLDALVAYSPQQIAVYLDSSNKTWQAVACGVLATQAERGTVTDWDGIGPGLAQVVLQNANPSVNQLGLRTLQSIPSISSSDIASMVGLLRRSEPSESRRAVCGIIFEKGVDAADDARELLSEWAESSVQADQLEAVLLLSKFFPDDARVATLLNEAATDWPSESDASPVVSSVLTKRHDLVPDLLRGTPREQRLALQAMSQRGVAFSRELTDEATALAGELLGSQEPESAKIAVLFLTIARPKEAGHVLVDTLSTVETETKVSILGSLRQIAWDAYQKNDGSFQFTVEEGNTLVRLLNDPSPAVRAAAAEVVNPGIPPGPRPQGAFVPGTGPLDPANADIFRRLLDAPAGETDWLALNYFARVTPFQESDVARVVAAIRRDEATLRAKGNTQATETSQAHSAFGELLRRFPEHPETRALARERFLARKSEGDAGFFFERFKPDDSEALALAQELFSTSTSNLIVLAAASYLWRSPAHRDAVQTAIAQRYRTSRATGGLAVQRTSSIRWAKLILTMAREPGNTVDSSIVKEILTDVLSQLWFGEARVEDVPDREQIEAALAADAIAECERAAVRKCLEERVFSKQVVAQSNSVAYCVQAMQHVPGFLDEADRAATQAIESDESDLRVRGLYLMAAARLDSAAMKDRGVERMDDRDMIVRAAAADALGALGINESRVIDKLRGMVDRKQPEPVRTAGVRNLALLAPQDPEIVKLIQSLADDTNFGTRTEARRALRTINSSQ